VWYRRIDKFNETGVIKFESNDRSSNFKTGLAQLSLLIEIPTQYYYTNTNNVWVTILKFIEYTQ